MNLLEISPSQGIFILEGFASHFQDLCQSLYIAQSLLSTTAFTSYTLSLHSSPYFLPKISYLHRYLSKVTSLSPLYVKSISQTSSFISNAEYICRTCCETFCITTDLTWNNTIQAPSRCRAYKYSQVPHSKVPKLTLECEGVCFDLLEGSLIYSDYQEFVVSDGKNEVLVVVHGGQCNSVRIGECIEVTGVYAQRWNQNGEPEYAFICLDFKPQPSSIIKAGIQTFRLQKLHSNDFSIRESIIRSSFSGIFGNYHIKLSLILNVIGHLCGLTFSTLVLGGISSGKSTIAKLLIHLFPDQCRIINGVLTNPKAFSQQKIMNASTGKYETGLLDSEYILVIDNFQALRDKKLLYKAMEIRSVIAMIESNDDNKEVNRDLSKNMKLSSEYDRFDIILSMKNYENNKEFRVKKLGDYALEDYANLWDFDTIKGYLYSNFRLHSEVPINSPKVQGLLQGYINYTVNYNLKNCDMPVASGVSVRLLESLIKISKANAILLGHSEVSIIDAVDAIVLINCSDIPDVFVDLELYKKTANEILNNVRECVGFIDL